MPLIDHFPDADLPEEASASVDIASTSDIESDNQTSQHNAFNDDLPTLVIRMLWALKE